MSFHVPELSRIVRGRLATDASYGNNGAFRIDSCEPGWDLFLICSDSTDADALGYDKWEHVSVSARRRLTDATRTPSWKEMCQVKRLCWDAEDAVMQLHPRESEYVNQHPRVLHLWRPIDAVIPEPPSIFVGIRSNGPTEAAEVQP